MILETDTSPDITHAPTVIPIYGYVASTLTIIGNGSVRYTPITLPLTTPMFAEIFTTMSLSPLSSKN